MEKRKTKATEVGTAEPLLAYRRGDATNQTSNRGDLLSARPSFGNLLIDPIFRRREVERITGLARSTIYAGVKAGTFPPPVRLGPNSVGWRQSAIADWLASRESQQ